jgi:hypothetical protein
MKWRKLDPRLLALLIGLHIFVAAVTWRDIGHRDPGQIRGPKWFWRLASAVQMGNSLVYWLFARRRLSPSQALAQSRHHGH